MNHKPIIWKTSVLGNCWGTRVILLKFSIALGATQNEKVKGAEFCTKGASQQHHCLGAHVSPGDRHGKLLTRSDLRWAQRVTGSQNILSRKAPTRIIESALKRVSHMGVTRTALELLCHASACWAHLREDTGKQVLFLVHSKHQQVWDRKQEKLHFVCTSSLGDKNQCYTKITLVYPSLITVCYLNFNKLRICGLSKRKGSSPGFHTAMN